LSFSYQLGNNPTIDYPRFLIRDVVPTNYLFEDEEILAAVNIETAVFQSGQFYSGNGGVS
jgi:hypothetical protein